MNPMRDREYMQWLIQHPTFILNQGAHNICYYQCVFFLEYTRLLYPSGIEMMN